MTEDRSGEAVASDDAADDGRVSLYPLEFEEALRGLLQTPPPPDEEGADDGGR